MGGEGSAGLGIIPKKHFFSASLIDLVTVVREYYSCTNNTLLILHWCTLAYMWNCVRAPVNLLQSCSDRQCEKYTCGYAGCVEASRELVSYSSSFNHQPVFRGGGQSEVIALVADCISGDCRISSVLQPSRSFCRNLPVFVVSPPTIQWITPLGICDAVSDRDDR